VPYGLKWGTALKRHHEEQSQRTRGFLYLTLGAATAVHVGVRELFVYENGIGAINLPYDGTQIGTSNSRGVHPAGLMGMAEFVRILTGADFRIQSPFLFQTKADMCRHGAVRCLAASLPLTYSCDSFPVRFKNKAQCGICTSCLLRRQSLESAGLAGYDREGYLYDLSSPAFEGTKRQLDSIRAMEWQAQRMTKALEEADPWRALVREFVEIRRLETLCHSADDVQDLRQDILSLYSRYLADWQTFSARNHCDSRKLAA
jgi:hypothetical protein